MLSQGNSKVSEVIFLQAWGSEFSPPEPISTLVILVLRKRQETLRSVVTRFSQKPYLKRADRE